MFKFNNLGYIVVAKRMHLALEAMQCLIEFLIWTICIIKIRNSFAMVSIFVGLPWQSGIPVKVFMWFGKGYIFLAVYKPFIWYLFKPLSKLTSTGSSTCFFWRCSKPTMLLYTRHVSTKWSTSNTRTQSCSVIFEHPRTRSLLVLSRYRPILNTRRPVCRQSFDKVL